MFGRAFKLIAVILIIFCYGLPNYAVYILSGRSLEVMTVLGINVSQFSALTTAPMLIGAVCSLFMGMLMDRSNAKMVMGVAISISSLAAVGRIFASSFYQIWICSVFIGLAAAVGNACTPKILSQWFDKSSIDRVCGIIIAFASCLMGLGTATGGMYKSLNSAFIWSAILLCVTCACWFILIPSSKKGSAVNHGESVPVASGSSVFAFFYTVIKNRIIWIVAFAWLFQVASNTGFCSFFAAILNQRGLGNVTAGIIASTFTYGTAVGCMLGPQCFRWFGVRKKGWLVFCGIASGILTITIWQFTKSSLFTLFLLTAMNGFFSGNITSYYFSISLFIPGIGEKYVGTAGGLLSTITLIASVVLPTYVYAPISGGNLPVFFCLLGLGYILCGTLSAFVPVSKIFAYNDEI